MKILISTDRYIQNINGVTNSVLSLIKELRKRGHEVKILTLSADRHSHKENEDEYYIGSFFIPFYPDARYSFRFFDPLLRELIEWKPDLLHIHTEFASRHLAMRIVRSVHCPYICTCHTMYEDYIKKNIGNIQFIRLFIICISAYLYNRARVVIAPSAKMKTLLRSYHVIRPIAVIPTGIELEKYQRRVSARKRMQLMNKLHILPEYRILIVISRLGREKNIEELIEYMPALIHRDPNVRLLIVGNGPDKAHLERLTHKLHLDHAVIFTGAVPPSHVYQYYQLGDIFVCASTFETQGLTYIEAMASGLPLVCRNDPCLQHVLTHGDNGFLYTNKQEYIDSIFSLLTNESLRKQMGYSSFLKSFAANQKQYGDRVEHIYQRILSSKDSSVSRNER